MYQKSLWLPPILERMVTSPSSLRPSIRLRTDFHHFAICKHVHSLNSTRSTRTILKKAPPYELNTHFFFVIIRAHRVASSANSVLRSKRDYQKKVLVLVARMLHPASTAALSQVPLQATTAADCLRISQPSTWATQLSLPLSLPLC